MANTVLGILGILLLFYGYRLGQDIVKKSSDLGSGNWCLSAIIGFAANFGDTLGIGSYATTAMALSLTKQLDNDKLLPGTLNVANVIPCMLEAFIFIKLVKVEGITLFALVLAAIFGAGIGAKIVPKLSEHKVQIYLGTGLLITAGLMAGKQLGLMEFLGTGNTAVGLSGGKLCIGVVGNFVFGALMTIGCGLYAPCMAMVYILGLNPIVAFPVMMSSCAALMPVASVEFIAAGDYARKVSLGILLGGIFGVFVAAKFVTNLDLHTLNWLVITVVIYTGILYVRKGLKGKGNMEQQEIEIMNESEEMEP